MKTKICKRCEVDYSLTNFRKDSKSKDGYRHICKSCNKRTQRAWYHERDGKIKVGKQKVNHRLRHDPLEWKIKKQLIKYHITREQYNKILSDQNGKCGICNKTLEELEIPVFNVDHFRACCNKAGSCGSCVRGLLCGSCNRALGMFLDSEEILLSAIKYLKQNSTASHFG